MPAIAEPRAPGAGDRAAARRLGRWLSAGAARSIAALAITLALAPMLVIFASWFSEQGEIWRHLREHRLAELVGDTARLLAGVVAGATALGVGLAWLVALHDFPGRRWLEWALALPLALPAYVLAFTALGALGLDGFAQRGLSAWLGDGFVGVDVRSGALLAATLSGAFYPYVYLLTRSALVWQGQRLRDAARTLGCGPVRAFWRVSLPNARPAIAAGAGLVAMETLADFGAVAAFNYDTLAVAVYQTWFGMFSPLAAAQLASLLGLFALAALCAERWSRGRARHVQPDPARCARRVRLRGVRALAASAAAAAPLLAFFALPAAQLGYWTALEWRRTDEWAAYLSMAAHSALLAGIAALATVALVSSVLLARRRAPSRWLSAGVAALGAGYAIPGVALAVGMTLALSALAEALSGLSAAAWLRNGLLALILAYVARFAMLAIAPLDAGLSRLDPALIDTARVLGAGAGRVARRVSLPLLAPGALSAAVLVFIEVAKEMPATLLLRPFGWDTLALRVFEMTAEARWQQAAPPALALVALGLAAVALALRAEFAVAKGRGGLPVALDVPVPKRVDARVAGAHLVAPLRVGEQRAPERDQVELAALQALEQRLDAADRGPAERR